jgi:hypothetical protein
MALGSCNADRMTVAGSLNSNCPGVIPQNVLESGKKIVVTDDDVMTLIEDHSDNTPHFFQSCMHAL